NEEFLDDTTPSVARKFLNEVKSTIVTLQHIVKHKMTLETHNWSSSAYQELHKIVKDENFPIVNQVDARVQNFEIQFLKKAAKFVRDFKSLAKEADESLSKHKAFEFEIKRLLRAVVSQDIMSVVQNNYVGETSNLQTELERTKKRFENCIIKKENEYAKLWNDWYKKCEECKFDKLSRLLKAVVSQDIMIIMQNESVVDTSDLQTELEQFHVLNYARENAHLKATYKNLFDSIFVSRAQTKTIIASLQNELQSNIYKNAKLRTQLFKKVSDQKDNTQDTSKNTKFAKQPIVETLPKIGVDNTKTRRPQPRSNTKNDRVPYAFKSSRSQNKEAEVEEHYRNLLLSKNNKHISSACNNIKIDSQDTEMELELEKTQQGFSHEVSDTDEVELAEVEDVIEVVNVAKLMTEVVTTATTPITAAQVPKASALRKRMGVIIQDPEEIAITSVIMHSEVKSKDKGKGILVEEPKPLKRQAQIEQDEAFARQLEAELNANINWNDVVDQVKRKEKQDNTVMRYQALKRNPITEAQARKNIMVYLKNMAGFKMDFFRGMTYNEIRPIFEKQYSLNQAFLERVEEEVIGQKKEGSKRKDDSPEQRAAKKQKIDKEV
nr:hypothetical protein [Tanacetum cinerariifolium]